MNPNQTRTLWLSLGLAVFAMFLIYSYSQEKKAEYDRRYGTTKRVVIAAKDILEMSTIDDTMLQVEEKPSDFLQPGAINSPEDAVGLVASAPFKKGEQILGTKLLTPGPTTGLALQVSPGKRAVTLPVDDVRGISKLIRPGNRIDIVTSIESGRGQTQKREVKTLLQDVVVLATGINVTNNIPRNLEVESGGKASFRNLRGDTTFTTVTVEVTPPEAQNLIYIMSSAPGSIYLTLRNPNDRATTQLATAGVESVLGRPVDLGDFTPRVPAVAPIVRPVIQAPPKKKRSGPFEEVR